MGRRSISATKREKVWQREKNKAYLAGLGSFPICIHCVLPVHQMKAWHVAHRKAAAFDGKDILDNLGVAHVDCNLADGAQVVTPAKAKADRVRRKNSGAQRLGMTQFALPAGRRSHKRKKINGQVVERDSELQRLVRMRRGKALVAADGTLVGVWAE